MKKQVSKLIDNNWFFLSLLLFAFFLPLSQALVSVGAGVILFTAFIEDSWKNKFKRIKEKRILFSLPTIYLIYIISSLVSEKFSSSVYDLQKSLFFFVIPLAFIIGKNLSNVQKRFVFYQFSVSIVISTVIAVLNWLIFDNQQVFSVHFASLISHIRFSFQLILAFWFTILLLQKNLSNLKINQILILTIGAFYFLGFLVFQQSLTGLIALVGSAFVYLILLYKKVSKQFRIYLFAFLLLLVGIPTAYVINAILKFYDFEIIDQNRIDKHTAKGNLYRHDYTSPMVENGRYVYLYVCPKEMKEEWNKISNVGYDSLDVNGYPLHSTLVRYLTSKGLRKDAEGVRSLDKNDIENVENGIANIIYAEKKFSLYPRIYQTIWEYYTYKKTGNANQKSFSQRIEYAKAAISIIERHPWTGVGTGQWKEEFKNFYVQNNSTLREEFYASSHNQYLNYMVKFGIIGFMVIMFLLVYPVIKTKKYSDRLFLLFLIFMFLANFADSNFESHMGSSFFVFFYCFFMIGESNYFELPWQKQP